MPSKRILKETPVFVYSALGTCDVVMITSSCLLLSESQFRIQRIPKQIHFLGLCVFKAKDEIPTAFSLSSRITP